jgi:hypothetical protein
MLLDQFPYKTEVKFGFDLAVEVVLRYQALKRNSDMLFERALFMT